MSHGHDRAECRELFSKLSEYLDGELDEAACDGVEGHLGDCRPCRAFLESLRRTVRLVSTLEPVRLDDAMRRRIIEDCRRMQQPAADDSTTE